MIWISLNVAQCRYIVGGNGLYWWEHKYQWICSVLYFFFLANHSHHYLRVTDRNKLQPARVCRGNDDCAAKPASPTSIVHYLRRYWRQFRRADAKSKRQTTNGKCAASGALRTSFPAGRTADFDLRARVKGNSAALSRRCLRQTHLCWRCIGGFSLANANLISCHGANRRRRLYNFSSWLCAVPCTTGFLRVMYMYICM